MDLPENLLYSAEHQWVDWTPGADEPVGVGLTGYATEVLGHIVRVRLPELGGRVTVGEVCGEVESAKSVNDIHAPVTGEVVEINLAVLEEPGLVNVDPYRTGWLFRVRVETAAGLLTSSRYAELVTNG